MTFVDEIEFEKLGLREDENEKKIVMLDPFKDKHYGKRGTAKRDRLEAGYENFKIGALIHEARLEKGLTQEELAENVGTTNRTFRKLKTTLERHASRHFRKLLSLCLGEHFGAFN